MPLNYAYEKRLQVGYIGTGEHSYRHILPCLRYVPIELVAMADHNTERGVAVARQFGARRFYPNHKALLGKEKLDALLVVVGPDAQGRPRYPEIAADALSAGLHVWVDAPPCASANDIRAYTDACLRARRYIMTGFRRMFAPAYVKAKELLARPDFGKTLGFSLHYPMIFAKDTSFLRFVHPYSVLVYLFGEAQSFSLLRSEPSGMMTLLFRFRDVVGNLVLTGAPEARDAWERLEIYGTGGWIAVEGGARVTYQPYGARSSAGWEDPLGSGAEAPRLWQANVASEGYLDGGILINGYVGCLRHFAEQLLQGEPPRYGNLVEMLHIMTVHDKILTAQEGTWVAI